MITYVTCENLVRDRTCFCVCDTCQTHFTFPYKNVKRRNKEFSFCSKECMKIALRTNGIIFERSKKVNIERYGTECPSKSDFIKNKIKHTCIEKYGVENPFQSEEKKQKIKLTNVERFGVENPFQSEKIKDKIKLSLQERYGVTHPLKSQKIKAKQQATNIERYGGISPLCKPEIHLAGILAASKPEVRNRAHETMKRECSYGKSRSEDKFYDLLVETYGSFDVERQKRINHWSIDFYVKSINTYVQFDGVYWHGLDRPIEIIQQFKNKRDVRIYSSWLNDLKQNCWFEINNLRLVRVTDVEFLNNSLLYTMNILGKVTV